MGKIYSKDFRECVIENLNSGMSRSEACHIFNVSSNTLSRWLRWQKDKGDLSTPSRGRYKYRKFSDEDLICYIETNNDSTLEEISSHFSVAINAICRRLKLLGITSKKNQALRRKRREEAYRIPSCNFKI